MSLPENHDPLDALLQEQNEHVADDGFTKRVIASLPRRRSQWSPQFLLLAAAVVGWVLAAWSLPWRNLQPLTLSSLSSADSRVLWPWAVMFCVVGALIWAMIAAIQSEDQD